MDYKELKKLYETQFDTLTKLLENKNFVSLMKEDELFKTNFIDQISVLKFLEKKLSDPNLIEKEISNSKKKKKKLDLIDIKDLNKSSDCSLQFVTVVGQLGSLNDFKEIKKTEEIKDVIKYFDVFLKNTYKTNVKSFLENSSNETFKAEKVSNNDFFKKSSNTNNHNNNESFANPFMGGFASQNNMSYDIWKEQQVLITANQQLKNLIDSGEFYLYKSKPKFFIINKTILASILVFISLLWLIVFLLQIVVTSEQSPYYGLLFFGSPSSPGLVSVVAGNDIFSYIITILSITYFSIWCYKLLKKSKSENELFAFDKKSACIVIFLVLIIGSIFAFLLSTWIPNLNPVINFDNSNKVTYENIIPQNSNTAKLAFECCVWITLVSVCSLLFLVLWVIICWIYAPKPDGERIQLKLEELSKSIREMQA